MTLNHDKARLWSPRERKALEGLKRGSVQVLQGIEFGPPGWQAAMLSTTPQHLAMRKCGKITTNSNFCQISLLLKVSKSSKRLGTFQISFYIVTNSRTPNDWVKFFQLRTEYKKSMAFFGNFWGPAQSIYIIKDLETGEFNIWHPSRWHHLCYAYDKSSSHIGLVKVNN